MGFIFEIYFWALRSEFINSRIIVWKLEEKCGTIGKRFGKYSGLFPRAMHPKGTQENSHACMDI